MDDSYISVSQLNNYIRDIFYSEVMLQNICVFGEISSYSISNNIAYFNLKDENGLLSCVLFNANKFNVPKIGDMVLIKGSMNYYIKGGKLSFNAVSIAPYGRGMLYEKFLQLKAELETLGYFDQSIKKSIPKSVKRIGVVTSQTGAVIRDIIDVTHRRNDTIDIVLYPVKVQGLGADKEIAQGINFFSNYDNVDVIIVARGGGSIEDLEPFNSRIVADATYECKKPIVSAVGHETDFTIIDFVSDLRAPTPSAGAELVAWSKTQELENIDNCIYNIENIIKNKLLILNKDIDFSCEKLDNLATKQINKSYKDLDLSFVSLSKIDKVIDNTNSTLDKLSLLIESKNPKKIADMGYSKIFQSGKVVKEKRCLNKTELINISFVDGNIDCRIISEEV